MIISHRRFNIIILLGLLLQAVIFSYSQSGFTQTWPNRAVRSEAYAPAPRKFAVATQFSGAQVPRVGDSNGGRSYIIEPGLIWNFAFNRQVSIFGSHRIGKMKWANVALMTVYNELGVRISWHPKVWFEGTYLSHRVEASWIDGNKIYVGGVVDHGAEAAVWIEGTPVPRLKLSARLCARTFSVYNDNHDVFSTKWQLSLLPVDNHGLYLAVELVEVWREKPRAGVERFTHNTVGSVEWRSMPWDKMGFYIAAMVSLNLLVGEVPMLELKRSMINEPMGLGTVGFFFEL